MLDKLGQKPLFAIARSLGVRYSEVCADGKRRPLPLAQLRELLNKEITRRGFAQTDIDKIVAREAARLSSLGNGSRKTRTPSAPAQATVATAPATAPEATPEAVKSTEEAPMVAAEAKPAEAVAEPVAKDGNILKQLNKAVASIPACADQAANEAYNKLADFFSEFAFVPKARFVDTFARACVAGNASEYVTGYFQVSGNESSAAISEKIKSPEFGDIVAKFAALPHTAKAVNTRFAVFYGEPGGGKTTAALAAARAVYPNACCLACSTSAEPSDLLWEYFQDYETGKKGFRPSALLEAIRGGLPVVLDEINLLSDPARCFLQALTDGKSSVEIQGQTEAIADGFCIIGTMNIETGLGPQYLPAPLVDRAAVIREFVPNAEQVMKQAGF